MAITWDRSHETSTTGTTGTASYDALTGMYQITRTYQVNAEIATAIGDFTDTNIYSFTITHTDGATVTMREVARDATRIVGGASPQSRVVVTYEGHVLGVIRPEGESGTRTEKILYDLSPAHYIATSTGGVPSGIGPKNEGTNRYIPHSIWRVVHNVSSVYFYGTLWEIVSALNTCVNEDNWVFPTDTLIGSYWDAGTWLYLGMQFTRNRDTTFTLIHQFDFDNIDYHNVPWRPIVSESVSSTVGDKTKTGEVYTFGDVTNAQIYKICGRTATEMATYPLAYTDRRFEELFVTEV